MTITGILFTVRVYSKLWINDYICKERATEDFCQHRIEWEEIEICKNIRESGMNALKIMISGRYRVTAQKGVKVNEY